MSQAAENGIRVLALFPGVVKYGAERANLEALDGLAERGARVKLLAHDVPWGADMRAELSNRGYDYDTAPFIVPPRPDYPINPWIRFPWIILRASAAFLRAHWTFRSTHFQASTQMAVFSVLPVLLLTRTPLVYRCGDRPILHNRIYGWVWRYITRRASAFVAVSEFIAERMREAGTPPDRLQVIYSRPPARGQIVPFDASQVETDAFNIAYVGQVNPTKGVDKLVEAFSRLTARYPKARLLIAGRISDWVGDAWARELRDRTLANPDLKGKVKFLGFLEDVPGLLAHSDVAVAPTVTDEPLANVVMEAKQAGLPAIVFNSGGLPEVVEHGVNGLICQDRTAEALASALEIYLSDPELAARHGEAARASLERLGVDAFADRWTAVYRAAAEPSR